MHERALITSLLQQVNQLRVREGGQRVSEVRVEIGPLSGVETPLLQTAFAELASARWVCGARLVIDEVSLSATCLSCDHQFEVQDFDFRCPACRQAVRLQRGDQCLLVSVTLEDAASTAEPIT